MNERKGKQSPVAMILSSHNSTTNKAIEMFKPSDDAESPPVTILKNLEEFGIDFVVVRSY